VAEDLNGVNDTIVIHKNRQRAFWALVIVGFMALVSIVLLLTGLLNRSGIQWTTVTLGMVGLFGFGACAALVIQTMRSAWHLALSPTHLILHTPTYVLTVPWEDVAGIVVAEVNWRLGCALIFEDAVAVAQGARFLVRSSRPDVITDATRMLARMKENYAELGYHLGIPGRILEFGPEALAELLTKARTGQLWRKGETEE
jgi:hypothetical protein